jgi:DNA mismatch endonuclease (patch repair protein)
MRAVKSRGNKSTELKLIEIFKTEKILGWRRNYKLFGKPDFVFPKRRLAMTNFTFRQSRNFGRDFRY